MKYENGLILSSEEEKNKMRVNNLSLDFAKRMVFLNRFLDKESREHVISKQILRSGTSIGANIAEAEHPQSDADYLSKMSIALKEANETKFWLQLLRDCEYIPKDYAESLLNDCCRIISILVIVVNKVSKRIKKHP